ncbi:MAG: DUF3575 domain-containing protein [Alistipes sp.]|nr:DUF3575 domain-containing protein [Alistipes sp.]
MRKIFTLLTLLCLCCGAFAQTAPDEVVTFRFVPGDDMFYIPWEGNDAELNRLYSLLDRYRSEITDGAIPVYVDGYSPTKSLSFIRANRVKSEMILHKGLREDNFITRNFATAYTAPEGTVYKNMVVVTLQIPATPEPRPEPKPQKPEPQPDPDPVTEPQPEPIAEPEPMPEPAPTASWWQNEPYRLAVRTNLLYDGFGLPTLGLEYRINRHVGIKLDGSRSWWGDAGGKVQKIWLVSPEVRWYLLDSKRLYVGAGANFGKYNIYKYPVGGLFSSDTGYQGKIWSAGATVGYQLYLSPCFSLDFNVGLGYTHSEYDSFNIENGERVNKDRDKTKTLWGPTQAGVSLIWTIGNK